MLEECHISGPRWRFMMDCETRRGIVKAIEGMNEPSLSRSGRMT